MTVHCRSVLGRCRWAGVRQDVASIVGHSDEIAGSQTGSQRPLACGDAGPRPAILDAAGAVVMRHRAIPSDTGKVPPKQ
jgi:hypothetical protein